MDLGGQGGGPRGDMWAYIYTHTHIADSLCYMAEANNIVKQLLSQLKMKCHNF